jgi:hypothetical protein
VVRRASQRECSDCSLPAVQYRRFSFTTVHVPVYCKYTYNFQIKVCVPKEYIGSTRSFTWWGQIDFSYGILPAYQTFSLLGPISLCATNKSMMYHIQICLSLKCIGLTSNYIQYTLIINPFCRLLPKSYGPFSFMDFTIKVVCPLKVDYLHMSFEFFEF